MKTKKIAMLLLACLFLVACLPTPDTEYVVNKADNIVEQKVSADGSKDSAAAKDAAQRFPDRWDEDTYKVNDWLSIGFKAEVVQKADGLYPVFRTRKDVITSEEMTAWATAVLPAPVSVQTLIMTKEDYKRELQRYLDMIAEKQAWIDAGKPNDGVDRDEWMPSPEEIEETTNRYTEQIQNAPDENPVTPVSDYRNMPVDNRRYRLTDGTDAFIFIGSRGEYIGIAKGCQTGPYVYYDYYYEDEQDETDYPWPRIWQEVTMQREDAEAILDKELKRIGVEDFSVTSACKANLMDSGEGDFQKTAYVASKGWAFKLHRNLGGYPTVGVPYEPAQGLNYGTDNTMANAYIPNEEMEIVVDENGIQFFGFANKKQVVGIENTNVELLPWDEVQMRIKNSLAMCYNTEWAKETNRPAELEIYRLLLTSYTVHMRDSEDYYEMPVWVVFYDELQWGGSEAMRESMDLQHDALFINAVDGSVIHTDWGY